MTTPNDYGWWADRFIEGYEGSLGDLLDEWGSLRAKDDASEISAKCQALLSSAYEDLANYTSSLGGILDRLNHNKKEPKKP